MTWQTAAAMNLLIAAGYFAICGTIVRGLLTTRQLRSNPLAVATAAIFFTCAVHHGAHTVHMLLPTFGIDHGEGIALREAFGWQMVLWDVVGAAVALYYLSLRRSYGTLLRTPAMFEDEVRRRTAERVEHERELLTQAEELAGAGSWERDLRTGAVTWSAGMYRIRGYELGEEPASFANPKADLHPDDLERVERAFAVDGSNDDVQASYRIVRPDGAVRHLETRARIERDADGTATRLVGASVDVTERKAMELARDAAERELREREQMLSEAEERFRGAFENAPIGMALVGLNGRLLQVNAVLCEITGLDRDWLQRLDLSQLSEREDMRADDEALIRMTHGELDRYSTEKRFVRPDGRTVWVQLQVTLLRDREGGPVRFIAQIQDISGRRRDEEQLRHMANHDPLTGLLNRRSFERALSNQLAHVRRYGTSSALLFIDLDDFKYVNDSLGHADRTDGDYEPRIKARMAWLERIKRALLDGGAGFVLHAQPIVDVQSGEIVQHELLVRLVGEDGDLIAPGTFLPVAERFEITETAAISNIPLARRFGERLAEIGCELALDDFGAGYGSFYYLKHLPFDYLKIDGEFITGCVDSATDQLVIDAVVGLTHGLGKRTIAEFVSDDATLRYLREHGVDLAQGFHIGRPQPLERLLADDAPPPGLGPLSPAPPPTVR